MKPVEKKREMLSAIVENAQSEKIFFQERKKTKKDFVFSLKTVAKIKGILNNL